MSDLTKRMRELADLKYQFHTVHAPVVMRQAADRIDALEECLRNYMSQFGQALEAHGIPYGEEQDKADKQARALLEDK